ncbi:MAG TPA: glucosaminidase domain-containing protein [Acidimicrobiales bacterium]|nr:glucosaminidase domain-containing protein [Acidimicrobiales bacterium]
MVAPTGAAPSATLVAVPQEGPRALVARVVVAVVAGVLIGALPSTGWPAGVASATGVASAVGLPAATAPGATPIPALDREIHTEQLELVVGRAERTVLADWRTVDGERATLRRRLAAVAADRAAAGRAAALERTDARRLASASAARRAAATTEARAAAGLASADRRLGLLAVSLYVGSADPPAGTLAEAQLAVDQRAELDTVATAVELERGHAARSLAAAVRRLRGAERAARRARVAAADSTLGQATTVSILAAATASVGGARAGLAAAQGDLHQAQAERNLAAAGFDGPEGSSPDPPPSILGRPALDARQLAGWFTASGYVAATQASITQLARWYIEEGDAEGVRGDLAFAQAVLETGGFASPDAVAQHNFAGIGHCNSCATGWRFPNDRLGVRAQIQLLRTYAQPGLTAAQLANPPVVPALDPSRQYVEGCCTTWPSLTGVWATDPLYGRSILLMYQSMLAWALSSRG